MTAAVPVREFTEDPLSEPALALFDSGELRRRLHDEPPAHGALARAALAYRGGSPSQVYVQPYPALDHRAQVSIDGGINPAWRRDGREMYYLQDASAGGALRVRVMAVPVATTPTFSAGTPHILFEGPFRTDAPSAISTSPLTASAFSWSRKSTGSRRGCRRWCWCRTGSRN